VSSQAPELRERKIGITPFDCPRDNAVGPFVTAIVGSFLIGILVQAITRGAQERRAARELRYDLIAELTGVAAKLHVLLQMYRRTKHLTEEAEQSMPPQRRWWSRHPTQATRQPELAASWDRVRELRTELDEQYLECRRDGEVLEARLVAHFVDSWVQTAWHALVDCLIIRYCDAIDFPAFDSVLDAHAYGTGGRFHSGMERPELDASDLWGQLERAHNEHLQATATFVLELPLRGTRSTPRLRVLARRPGRRPPRAFTYEWKTDCGPRYQS
jgi:hypothetical protein